MPRICRLMIVALALTVLGTGHSEAQSDILQWYQSPQGFVFLYPAGWSSGAPADGSSGVVFRSPAGDAGVQSLSTVVGGPVDTTRYLIDQFASDRDDHPDLEALGAVATDITGADSAALTAESYTVDGAPWGTFKIAAQRGSLLTLFVIQTSQAYADGHEGLLQQMVGSFQFPIPIDESAPLVFTAGGQGDSIAGTFQNDGRRLLVCWSADGVSPATGIGPSASFSIRPEGSSEPSAHFLLNTFGRHCAYADIGTGTFEIEIAATPWTSWTLSVR